MLMAVTGRVEKFWEKKGQKVVTVRWFYHPEEVKSPKRIPHLKHPVSGLTLSLSPD